MTSETMGDPVNQSQFYDAIQQLRDLIDLRHTTMRQYVGERSDKIEAVLHEHSVDDAAQFKAITDRVLVIETERTGEKAQALKRATFVGIVAASAMSALWKALEHFSK